MFNFMRKKPEPEPKQLPIGLLGMSEEDVWRKGYTAILEEALDTDDKVFLDMDGELHSRRRLVHIKLESMRYKHVSEPVWTMVDLIRSIPQRFKVVMYTHSHGDDCGEDEYIIINDMNIDAEPLKMNKHNYRCNQPEWSFLNSSEKTLLAKEAHKHIDNREKYEKEHSREAMIKRYKESL